MRIHAVSAPLKAAAATWAIGPARGRGEGRRGVSGRRQRGGGSMPAGRQATSEKGSSGARTGHGVGRGGAAEEDGSGAERGRGERGALDLPQQGRCVRRGVGRGQPSNGEAPWVPFPAEQVASGEEGPAELNPSHLKAVPLVRRGRGSLNDGRHVLRIGGLHHDSGAGAHAACRLGQHVTQIISPGIPGQIRTRYSLGCLRIAQELKGNWFTQARQASVSLPNKNREFATCVVLGRFLFT